MRVPSGLNAAAMKLAMWPCRAIRLWLEAASYIREVLS